MRIRTLRGGEGFLSQSSNWIHFGLGDASGIEKLVIRWPGGEPQEITGIEPGRFYRISQGKEVPEIFRPPESRFPLTPSAPSLAAMEESARIIVAPGLPLPQLPTIGPDGSRARGHSLGGIEATHKVAGQGAHEQQLLDRNRRPWL